MPSAIALIGARSGSERVPGKNVRRLAGHPLLAYAIETARQSQVFDRIVVSFWNEATNNAITFSGDITRGGDFTVPVPQELRTGFADPFRSMPRSELEILSGVVLVRKQ